MKVKIGYAVLKNGQPVRTGNYGSTSCKLYQKSGMAVRTARKVGGMVVEVFMEVPE